MQPDDGHVPEDHPSARRPAASVTAASDEGIDFARLFRHFPETIVRYDRHGRIAAVNDEFVRRTGRTLEQVIGSLPFGWTDDQDLVPDVQEYRQLLTETLATGEVRQMIRTRPTGGPLQIYQVRFVPVCGADGEIDGAFAVASNVSELEEARQEIARREHEFRTLSDNLPDIVIRYDADARATYVNRSIDLPSAPDRSTLLGRTPTESSHRDIGDLAEYEARLRRVIASGVSDTIDIELLDASGHPRVHSVLFRAERSQAGAVVGAIAFGRDVTDLVRARRELAGHEHEYRTLAENLPDIVLRYDLDGRTVYVNPQHDEQVNAQLVDLIGRRPTEIEFDGMTGVEEYEAALLRVLATGEPEPCDITLLDRDGDRRTHHVLFRAERDEAGVITGALAIGRDVTELVRAREAIADRERVFRTLAENLPDVLIRYDRDGRLSYVNHQYQLQVHAGPAVGLTVDELGPPGQPGEGYRACVRRALTTGEPGELTVPIVTPAGEHRVHIVSMRAEYDNQRQICGAIAIGRDVTDLMQAQQHVVFSERQFRTLAENATDFIGRWDRDARRVYVNPALAVLMGGTPETLLGHASVGGPTGQFIEISQAIHRCIDEARPLTAEQRYVDRDTGEEHIHDVQLVPEFDADGLLASVLVIGRDITEVVHQREALERAARTDALTGVSSRQVLYERLPAILADRRATGGRAAVLLLDLDGFKHINDQYGHRLGDRILRLVGQRLAECVGPDDVLVRVGGDEFVIVLGDVDGPTDASLLAHQARLRLTALEHDDDTPYPSIDASVGIAMFPDHGDDVDVLLAHSDLALYDAKRAGRGRVEFFRAELRSAMERRSELEQALRTCVPDTEMTLHLQPICHIASDPHVWGAEALLRWHHPVLGRVGPDEFIPIAEQSGQIVPIGRWVLRRAAEIAVTLNRERSRPLRIAVNVSTRQFTLDDIADAVGDALRTTGCDPRWLIIEITESLMLEDLPLVNGALDSLRRLGIAIAIDDFGTGYSALHYLTRLRVDHMKVDKSFVRDADVDRGQQEIVRALVAMAHALGIEVVAEGIETQGQASLLSELGCRLGQGYLLAEPMPLTDFEEWLATAPSSLRHALPV